MTVSEVIYITAGCLLPLYYGPQILRCLRDDAGLASYSLRKATVQLALRVLMMPFIWGVGNLTMTVIVSLDLIGRSIELAAAVTALRAQGATWRHVAARVLPAAFKWRASPPATGMPPLSPP